MALHGNSLDPSSLPSNFTEAAMRTPELARLMAAGPGERAPREAPTAPPVLAHAQVGEGRDVILIHGAMTCLDDMAIALFPILKDEFRVTAFDRPGHGASPNPFVTGTPWRQAQAVHDTAQALGLVRPVVVGHSFGGAVALAYGLLYPNETTGIVALSPIAFPEARLEHVLFAPRAAPGPLGFWNHSVAGLLDPLLLPLLWRAMFLPQDMPTAFVEGFPFAQAGKPRQTYAEAQDAAMMAPGLLRSAANYARCQVPVRILAGDRDHVVNTALHAGGLARALPKAHLTRLEGLGHMIHHFAQPAIAQAIRDLHASSYFKV
jgi:pimeloyl-ACP methyl ester carboxylesterase